MPSCTEYPSKTGKILTNLSLKKVHLYQDSRPATIFWSKSLIFENVKSERVAVNFRKSRTPRASTIISNNLTSRHENMFAASIFTMSMIQHHFYAPNFEKVGDILVSACPYDVCMYVCMYSCSRYCLETSCMDSSWKNSRGIFLVFPELSPLV